MNSPPNNPTPDELFIDDDAIDQWDAAFDDYREDVLYESGLEELKEILSKEEFEALEQFLVYPIYDLVGCDGKKVAMKHFRESIENTVKITAYLHRTALQLGIRKTYLEHRIKNADRTIYVCLGIIVTLFAAVLYCVSM